MQPPPVAVVPLSQFNQPRFAAHLFLATLLYLLPSLCLAQIDKTVPTPYVADEDASGYLARIGFNDPEQVSEALMRVEGLYEFDSGAQLVNPVAFVVHGPEVSIFQKENYQEHKGIVDLAARLSALGIIDISVCETRLRLEGVNKESVYPFVGTVPFGPTEVDRLLRKENYIYF